MVHICTHTVSINPHISTGQNRSLIWRPILPCSYLSKLLCNRYLPQAASKLQILFFLFFQLVDYCRKYSIPMPSMKYFLVKDLPLESSHQFRIWFVDLWNLVLVEEFKKELEGMDLFFFTFLAYILSIVELKRGG